MPSEGRSAARRCLAAVALVSLMLAAIAPAAAAPSPRVGASELVAIHQSAYTIEQANFTVGIELSDAAAVSKAWFTFCQLSQPLCYNPVFMTQNSTHWYSGSTNLMSSYNGMVEGVHAGYNITVQFVNGTNLTAPSVPNTFSALTVAQEVCAPTPCVGAYMFEMTVGPNLYSVSGTVKDATTGAALAGATVSVSPGSNSTTTSASGGYTLGGLTNGTYTLSISDGGYRTTTQGVTINGQDAVQNVPLSNGTGTSVPPSQGAPVSAWSGYLPWIALGAVVIVVLAVLGVLFLRRRGGGSQAAGPSAGSSARGPPPPG